MCNLVAKFMRSVRVFFFVASFGIFFLGMVPNRLLASQMLTLTWNPSTNADVVAYNVYYGTTSHEYSQPINLDNVTSTEIFCSQSGVTYYFAVTAVDSAGHESAYSQEVFYTVPLPGVPKLETQVYNDANGQPYFMTVSASSDQTGWWELDFSSDLKSWTPYLYGLGSDVFAETLLTNDAQPRGFFRLMYY